MVERVRGGAREFHERSIDGIDRPTVWIFEVEGAALALGSTQSPGDVDADAAARSDTEVVTRRSGGGAVLLQPGGSIWIDVLLPRHDDRWSDDVSRASQWLGVAWQRALAAIGVERAEVPLGRLEPTALSPVVCFAGLAPGELTLDGVKIVGISQRRTRSVARFQSVLMLDWDAPAHDALLGPALRRVGIDHVPRVDGLRSLRPAARLGAIVEELLATL